MGFKSDIEIAQELREKLIEIEELRRAGVPDIPARSASANLRAALKEKAYV